MFTYAFDLPMQEEVVHVSREEHSQLQQLAEKRLCRLISELVYVELAISICPKLKVGVINKLVVIDSFMSIPKWPDRSGE